MPSNARRRPPAKNATEARQPGFDDVSVFRRHFTSQAGLSPSAYRRTFG
jgi:transcriptional regulator GlxA family with amidase domain